MKPEMTTAAAVKVGNPHILINLISRRVRQFNAGGGGASRPLLSETAGMGFGDIALSEILEDKMGWELHEDNPLLANLEKGRKKKR